MIININRRTSSNTPEELDLFTLLATAWAKANKIKPVMVMSLLSDVQGFSYFTSWMEVTMGIPTTVSFMPTGKDPFGDEISAVVVNIEENANFTKLLLSIQNDKT